MRTLLIEKEISQLFSNALCRSWKTESKVVNFDKLLYYIIFLPQINAFYSVFFPGSKFVTNMRYGVGSEVHDSSRRRDAGQLVLRQQDISGYLVVKIWVWVCVDIFLDSLLLEYNGCETHIHMCVYFQVVEFDTFVFPSSAWVALGAKRAEGNMEAAHF